MEPLPPCPTCCGPLGRWGGYARWARFPDAGDQRLWIRRVRCAACQVSHALLPAFLLVRRLDPAATIGAALTQAAAGQGVRPIAARLGVPHTTVRSWWDRVRANAATLLPPLLALATRLDSAPVDLPADGAPAVLAALDATWQRVRRRLGARTPEVWALWSVVSGGRARAPNTSSPSPPGQESRSLVASP